MNVHSWNPYEGKKDKKPLVFSVKQRAKIKRNLAGVSASLNALFGSKNAETDFNPWPNRWAKKRV